MTTATPRPAATGSADPATTAQTFEAIGGVLEIRRVAGHIGAELSGVDLSQPLSPLQVRAVWAAVLKYKVVFFHGQHLTHAQHIALGRQFGRLTGRSRPQSNAALDEHPEILTISPQVDRERFGKDMEAIYRERWRSSSTGWHSDVTHAVNPPAASILRAETVPAYGGDTQWTNLVAAYAGLPQPLRDLADRLRAVHTFFAGYALTEYHLQDREILDMINADAKVSIHPVVRVHPETGERALFVSPSRTEAIVGVSPTQSRHLLSLLFAETARPEYTVRFRWQPGDIAFWDNRSTAHLGATDFTHLDATRVMHRVTLLGDRPLGPDGYVSEAVTGQPITAV
jgi:taurine dioxygenase